MSFLKEHCSLFSVNEPKELEGFNCGDLDIDEFFANDCFGFTKQLFFAKTSDWANEQEFRVIVKCANEMRTKINFRNSLQAAVLYFAEDVEKGDSVF